METKKLKVDKRSISGRKLKKLRTSGILPANLYGKGIKSEGLQVKLIDFLKVYKEVGETGIITLEVEGSEKGRPVLIGNLQRNPMTDDVIHVDFRQVDLKERIEAQVPVVLIGESPAEKQSLGTAVLLLNEITVEALPMDLPEKFEVSIDLLVEVDQAIYVKDIKVSREVEIKTDLEAIVVKVEPPQKEEVVEVAAAPVDGEVAATENSSAESDSSKPEAKE